MIFTFFKNKFKVSYSQKFSKQFSTPVIANDGENLSVEIKDKIKKEYARLYRINNRDKTREYARQYRINNKQNLNEYSRKYRNRESQKERARQYRIINKQKLKEYEIINKEKIKEKKTEYYTKNKELLIKKKRKYNLKNRKIIREKQIEYYIKNKETLREKKRHYNIKKNKYYIQRRRNIYSWKTRESTKRFFEIHAKSLHIFQLSDWERVSKDQIKKAGGGGMFLRFKSLGRALSYAYPEHPWNLDFISSKSQKKATQRWLFFKMKQLLPSEDIIEDFRHPLLIWEKENMRNKYMQLDVWVPKYKLALEYQGEHHYNIIHAFDSVLSEVQHRDQQKKIACVKNGITLICIPYWWDGTVASLSSSLHEYFPLLFPLTDSLPIPHSLPENFKRTKTKRPLINHHNLKDCVNNNNNIDQNVE